MWESEHRARLLHTDSRMQGVHSLFSNASSYRASHNLSASRLRGDGSELESEPKRARILLKRNESDQEGVTLQDFTSYDTISAMVEHTNPQSMQTTGLIVPSLLAKIDTVTLKELDDLLLRIRISQESQESQESQKDKEWLIEWFKSNREKTSRIFQIANVMNVRKDFLEMLTKNFFESLKTYMERNESSWTPSEINECSGIEDVCYQLTSLCPLEKINDLNEMHMIDAGTYEKLIKTVTDLTRVYSITKNNILTVKELQKQRLDDGDAITLANALSMGALPRLEHLALSYQIGDKGLIALSSAFGDGAVSQLKWLRLSRNQIGDDGLNALSYALGHNRALSQLNWLTLADNRIGDAGLIALSDALDRGALQQLTSLFLEKNQIGNCGISALCSQAHDGALQQLTVLKVSVSNINDNDKIVEEGCTALAEAVEKALPKLNTLVMKNSKYGVKHSKIIEACKKRNVSLERGASVPLFLHNHA